MGSILQYGLQAKPANQNDQRGKGQRPYFFPSIQFGMRWETGIQWCSFGMFPQALASIDEMFPCAPESTSSKVLENLLVETKAFSVPKPPTRDEYQKLSPTAYEYVRRLRAIIHLNVLEASVDQLVQFLMSLISFRPTFDMDGMMKTYGLDIVAKPKLNIASSATASPDFAGFLFEPRQEEVQTQKKPLISFVVEDKAQLLELYWYNNFREQNSKLAPDTGIFIFGQICAELLAAALHNHKIREQGYRHGELIFGLSFIGFNVRFFRCFFPSDYLDTVQKDKYPSAHIIPVQCFPPLTNYAKEATLAPLQLNLMGSETQRKSAFECLSRLVAVSRLLAQVDGYIPF